MRRRDARRLAAASAAKARVTRAAARPTPVSPRALWCAARDAQEAGAAAMPRLATAVSIPSTLRRDAAALPRSRTVTGGGGAEGSPARPLPHHQRRNSLGALAEFGEGATPRPFLKRGTGTGGAAAPARLRTPRVHDLPAIDVTNSTPRLLLA